MVSHGGWKVMAHISTAPLRHEERRGLVPLGPDLLIRQDLLRGQRMIFHLPDELLPKARLLLQFLLDDRGLRIHGSTPFSENKNSARPGPAGAMPAISGRTLLRPWYHPV